MKAVVCTKYGSPEVLQITEIEKPVPKDNEVLVKIHATTVTAADYRVRSFDVPASFWLPARMALGLKKPRKPVLGMEISGKIEAVGQDVKTFKKGEEVFAATLSSFGGYAEYICIAEDGPIVIKPTVLTYEEAAAVPIGARTAFHYLKNIAEIKPGQKVLIYGASGSVGTYAVQLAKYFGAEVTGVCSNANLEMVKSLGADKVIDYTKSNFTEAFETYDIIFVTVDKCPFTACKNVLHQNGVYLNIGRPVPSLQMLWAAMTSGIKVVVGKNAPETADALFILKCIIEQGRLKPIIDRNYSLDQIVEAHRYVDKGHKKGNVVISIK
ncbi:NAD(P)-dependent alcohol dehydrogenase [Muriicola sp. Z0-33]|uniref:NAD(P)-dependent alcohol dehydrogenase n=1 Tax=Muriicola sp. Z0-33 TaxID=2816957 RepID=UPI0022382501|nr:NAD(P)-dependent alcohol dehydrogenase [Muriicola sp. Z0-33]MCW5518128.1 NAD(P)-dependent alcohol dehydrogenase [Muriicola sp. Z0-33]